MRAVTMDLRTDHIDPLIKNHESPILSGIIEIQRRLTDEQVEAVKREWRRKATSQNHHRLIHGGPLLSRVEL